MDKVRVGVIGTGALGRHHARLYKQCTHAELVGIYDIDSVAGKDVGREFGIPVFTSRQELLDQVDAVSISVPTDLHREIALQMFEQGIHVLVEKPLATNAANGQSMVEEARKRNLVLRVGHVENFNPVITYLRSILTAPLFVEAHRLAPFPPPREGRPPRGTEVGVVHDLMIHDLDLMLDLLQSNVTKIEAVGMPVLSKHEDIANVRLTFENACIANVTASRISPEKMRKIRVFQPDTYISLDYEDQNGEIHTRNMPGIERKTVPIEGCNALKVELDDFLEAVLTMKKTGAAPAFGVTGERALAALKLADEIVRSLQQHIHAHEKLQAMIPS